MWNIQLSPSGKKVVLKGQTNLPTAKADFTQQLAAKNIAIIDSIDLLPSEKLGAETFGIVNVSVCNIRSKNGHSQELATQSLLGTPIKNTTTKRQLVLDTNA